MKTLRILFILSSLLPLILKGQGIIHDLIRDNEKLSKEREKIKKNKIKYIEICEISNPEDINLRKAILYEQLKYDKNGNEIEKIETHEYNYLENDVGKQLTKYDSANNIIESNYIGYGGTHWVAEYGKYGMIKCTYYDRNNIPTYSNLKYDDKGNRIEQISYSSDNEIILKWVGRYDKDNNIIEEISYDGNNKISEKYLFEYNSCKQILRYIHLFRTPKIQNYDKTVASYYYDSKCNIIRIDVYDSTYKTGSRKEFEYDEFNNNIKQTEFSNDGKVYKETYCNFDKNGNIIEFIEKYNDQEGKVTTKYDEFDNKLQSIFWDTRTNKSYKIYNYTWETY